MAETKTKITRASVKDFVAKVENETRRKDAETLLKLMEKITGWKPRMFGPSIISFGVYSYTYDTGHSGKASVAGFSPRKAHPVVYITPEFEGREALVKKLGKVKTSVWCVYINKLADIDLAVLEKLIKASIVATKSKWPVSAG
jgi:hypothetical protein